MPKIIDPARSRKYQAISKMVGSRIREAREARELKGQELCQIIGRSTSWLSFVERGTNGVNIMDLMLISEALDLPVEYFLSDNEYVSSFRTPQNADDWRMMFPGEPERAAAHESIDRIYRNAQRVLSAQIKAGIGV